MQARKLGYILSEADKNTPLKSDCSVITIYRPISVLNVGLLNCAQGLEDATGSQTTDDYSQLIS